VARAGYFSQCDTTMTPVANHASPKSPFTALRIPASREITSCSCSSLNVTDALPDVRRQSYSRRPSRHG
jgi:hypothetical protein